MRHAKNKHFLYKTASQPPKRATVIAATPPDFIRTANLIFDTQPLREAAQRRKARRLIPP